VIESNLSKAEQIGHAAVAFEQQRTGHKPKSVTVILSEKILVVTFYGALSPAETALAKSPTGASLVQEFHRQVFDSTAESLRETIRTITGVEVREAALKLEASAGAVVHAFTSGTIVHVILLDGEVPNETWSESDIGR
jgi:uncharacterized protein YbcI